MSAVKPIEQEFATGPARLWAFAYLVLSLFARYTGRLLTLRMGPKRYATILLRLLRFLAVLVDNKVVKINGAYKYQLYLPAFPSPAFDRALWKFDPANPEPGPLTVVLSMTKACTHRCPHCYQRFDTGGELELETLKKAAKEMQDLGVAMFNIEGGEPLLKLDRLNELVRSLGDGVEVWVNTTGEGLTAEMAASMREAGTYGVMISLHSPDPREYDDFAGKEGSFQTALTAMGIFRQAGIAVAINYCPSVEHAKSDGIERLFAIARDHGCAFVQVIHGKPAGAWIGEKEKLILEEALVAHVRQLHVSFNREAPYADYPSISAHVFEESKQVFGCTAGGIDRFYVNHAGEVQPCEFLNISFGNLKDQPVREIYRRMRERFQTADVNWPCCAEQASITAAFAGMSPPRTPLPREETEKLIQSWGPQEEPPLYRALKLYPKKAPPG